ncbi:MAG TPA: sigma-70 family RNA polymerase sigma factor [Urbifossiella sp.]|nr:sigma-70 family RNA polymerase sigma factor [Urbifossiella sp.]
MSRAQHVSVLQVVQHISGAARAETDGQLLGQFVAGTDEAAYAELMRRHGGMVFRVCRRVLHNAHDAEDAFQATFLILARKAASVRAERSLASWLHGVARHTALRARDAATRRAANEARAGGRPAPAPLAEITVREAQAVFDAELAGLPAPLRAPLVLCYLEGKTQDEAARELGWSPATLRRRVARGREVLGARLTRRGLTLGAALSAGLLVPAGAIATAPPALSAATARAAVCLVSGRTVPAGLVGAGVAPLAKSTARAFTMTKLTMAALVVVGLGGVGLVAPVQPAAPGEPPGPKADVPGAGAWRVTAELKGIQEPVFAMAFSPDGQTLATENFDNQEGLSLWDTATGGHKTTLRPRAGRHRLVGFAADGRVLSASSVSNGREWVTVWDAAMGKEVKTIQTDGRIVLSPDGRTLAGGNTTGAVRLWDVATGEERAALRCDPDRILALTFSADGKTLAAASGGAVRLWDVATAKERGTLKSAAGGAWGVVAGWKAVPDHTWKAGIVWKGVPNAAVFPLPALALSPDGRVLATNRVAMPDQGPNAPPGALVPLASADQKSLNDVTLWDTTSGRELTTLRGHSGPVLDVLISPDGTAVATVSADKSLRLWDAKTGESRATIELENPFTGRVLFTPGGGAILAPTAGAVATLWDVKTGRRQADLAGPPGPWRCYAFSRDGRTLATAVSPPAGGPVAAQLWRTAGPPAPKAPVEPPAPRPGAVPEPPPVKVHPNPAPGRDRTAAKPGTPGAEYETLRDQFFDHLGTYVAAH